jgi:hypothetical protein
MSVTSLTNYLPEDSKTLIPFIGLLPSGGAMVSPNLIYLPRQTGLVTARATLVCESLTQSFRHSDTPSPLYELDNTSIEAFNISEFNFK